MQTQQIHQLPLCAVRRTLPKLSAKWAKKQEQQCKEQQKHTMDTTQQGPKSNDGTIKPEQKKQCRSNKSGEEE